MHSSNSLNELLPKIPKWIAFGFLVVSFLGFLDASYLAAKYYLGEPITCSILKGCETVTTSEYATIYGVPLGLLGAIYYLAVLLAAVAYFDSKKDKILFTLAPLTATGFLVSLVLIYLQLFVIHAICIYCMGSALSSTLLFGLGIATLRLTK